VQSIYQLYFHLSSFCLELRSRLAVACLCFMLSIPSTSIYAQSTLSSVDQNMLIGDSVLSSVKLGRHGRVRLWTAPEYVMELVLGILGGKCGALCWLLSAPHRCTIL
jgi:hypothetical protein